MMHLHFPGSSRPYSHVSCLGLEVRPWEAHHGPGTADETDLSGSRLATGSDFGATWTIVGPA